MADEKSIVKLNKMIHKKTGASFLGPVHTGTISYLSTSGPFQKVKPKFISLNQLPPAKNVEILSGLLTESKKRKI